MAIKNSIFLITLLLSPISFLVFGQTNYYIDKNATGNNSGSSWTNAWESFADINWSSISPGDTIYISGGTSSTVYNETLAISKSGSSGNRIVITKGLSPGHNGKVVIDGENIRDKCIDFSSSQYITVSYIKCENASRSELYMRTSNCTVSHCEIYHTEGIMSLDMRNGQNNIIEYVTADESPNPVTGSFNGNGDFMQCAGGGNNIFRYNNITVRDANINDHNDAFQFYFNNSSTPALDGGTWQIYGNIIYHADTKTTNAQGIYIEGLDSGVLDNTDWYIYNNLIILPYAKNGIAIRNNNLRAKIYSNTIYQGSGVANAGFWIKNKFATTIDNIVIKNNIFYSASTSVEPINITETLGPGCEVSNNLIYSPMSRPISYLGSGISLSTWNSYSFVGTDIEGDPLFNNISNLDFTLKPCSPARDVGAILGSPFNIDILGRQRPTGTSYDIGCYEFVDHN